MTWTLLCMGFAASLAGASALGAVGYLVAAVVLVVGAGPDDPSWAISSWTDGLAGSVGAALVAAVAARATRALALLWMHEEDEAAAGFTPDGRYGIDA